MSLPCKLAIRLGALALLSSISLAASAPLAQEPAFSTSQNMMQPCAILPLTDRGSFLIANRGGSLTSSDGFCSLSECLLPGKDEKGAPRPFATRQLLENREDTKLINAPSALARDGDMIIATDIDSIRFLRFDEKEKDKLIVIGSITIPGAQALNGLVVSGTDLYILDRDRGGILAVRNYRDAKQRKIERISANLARPVGLILLAGNLYCASSTHNILYQVDLAATKTQPIQIAPEKGQSLSFTTLAQGQDGEVLLAHAGEHTLISYHPVTKAATKMLSGIITPSTIHLQADGTLLLLDDQCNRLSIYPVKATK